MDLIPRIGAKRVGPIAGVCGLLFLPAIVGLAGCAGVQAPRGGPPDTIPPLLIAVVPDSLSVVSDFEGEVRFEFDESISERNIQTAATIFPFEARPRVKKGKREVRVRPRTGWAMDRIYHVQLEPVVQDLFNNPITKPIRHVFSTGAAMTSNRVEGTIYDRITGRALTRARIDMVHLPDTLRYGAAVDSLGDFALGWLPVGDFLAIGYEDLNGNRKADDFDRSDTIPVNLASADTLLLEFEVFRHDTLGPRVFKVTPVDSLVFELEFDGYLDPDAPIGAGDVQVISVEDSLPIAIDTVLHAWQFGWWQQARSEAARAAADTAAVEADTLAPEPAAPQDTAAAAPSPPDTAGAAAPEELQEPQEPEHRPDPRIYVVARAAIAPGMYRVVATGILNLSGLREDSEGTLEQPAPEPESEEGDENEGPGGPPRGPPGEPPARSERGEGGDG